MKLIVGLGNPGKFYEHNRHNIGSRTVKELARKHGAVLKKGLFGTSLNARVKISGEHCLLAVPASYMNLSGGPVKSLVVRNKIDLRDLIVVHDDLDIELGRLKVKNCGSSGGHNGLESVIGTLRSDTFCRLRIGIGRPGNKSVDVADYVLADFRKDELHAVNSAVDNACEALEFWVTAGADQTMNKINR